MDTKELLAYKEKKVQLQQVKNKLEAQMEVSKLKLQDIKEKLAKRGISKEDVPSTIAKLKEEISGLETLIQAELKGIQDKAKELGIDIPALVDSKGKTN